MSQIIVFNNFGSKLSDQWATALNDCGKTSHVSFSLHSTMKHLLNKAEPHLLFCDHGFLTKEVVARHLGPGGNIKGISGTPMIIIADFPMDAGVMHQDFEGALNIIHCVSTAEQADPANFYRLIKAFDIASEKGPLTIEHFQAALAEISAPPRQTKLDQRTTCALPENSKK